MGSEGSVWLCGSAPLHPEGPPAPSWPPCLPLSRGLDNTVSGPQPELSGRVGPTFQIVLLWSLERWYSTCHKLLTLQAGSGANTPRITFFVLVAKREPPKGRWPEKVVMPANNL